MPRFCHLLLLALLACLAWAHALPDGPPAAERVDHLTRSVSKPVPAPVVPVALPPSPTEPVPEPKLNRPELLAVPREAAPVRDRLAWLCRRQAEGG